VTKQSSNTAFERKDVLPGILEAQVRWGGKINQLLIDLFLSNISAKDY